MKRRKYNPNLIHLLKAFRGNKRAVVLEGSSRSGKTYSIIHFLIWYASQMEGPATCVIVRETAASFATTLHTDFKNILNDFGLDNPFAVNKRVTQFHIFDLSISFVGADDYTKLQGLSSNIAWINESINVSKDVYNQLAMRCKGMLILDYNPISSVSWIYDTLVEHPDTAFLRTTYKDNPYLSKQIIDTIESYDPNNKENIKNGTADSWLHSVFALGLRMAKTGLIFNNVNWIEQFPKNVELIGYGMDFGFVKDPTAITKIGVLGNEMYCELLFYAPTENADILDSILKALNLSNENIWADSASPGMISDLNRSGNKIFAINKFKGSINYGIGLLKSYNLHFVINKDLQKEVDNYAWRSINGVALDEPIDKHNHAIDSLRYNAMANFRK